ncbi:hypothetical protein [Longimicrobium terrae]|uniref:DUF3805 domain-containing protein n=1 Tax=Longimicrobium terrae TaxID=1639882 RepID=A0A841GYR2_9BACT|nr:hypothetical protein [Longimicrobium terrae]MBB4636589.1 hypothetical protein [Longimicrobium terrae]MBB6070887.1 hypothetical protein [Longimicrobium terrae]NNC28911.1 hypothetical protein [Longimicrobium terrae]
MTEPKRTSDPDGRFSIVLPAGWSAEPDEDQGGLEVWLEDGIGTLHLISFEGDEDSADPAEELYAFLEEDGVEIEEDDVEDLDIEEGELSICEYESSDEEDDEEPETTFWMQGVATAPGVLVFATYICPAGEQEAEREIVRKALGTLRLMAAE